MRIGVLVPDPGDRPEFAEQYKFLVLWQTRKAWSVCYVDEPRKGDSEPDLIARVKRGCEWLKDKCDLIAIFENDDFYARSYLEQFAVLWERHGRPDLLGFSRTIYYHLKLKRFCTIDHENRASLFSTAIASAAVDKIIWPDPDEVFLDLRLWSQQQLKRVAVTPSRVEAIGMKHGLGRIVSQGHKENFHRYEKGTDDKTFSFLRSATGTQFDFYRKLSERLNA